MAQDQSPPARSQVMWPRKDSELKAVEISGLVPGDQMSAGAVAVAVQLVRQVASIRASGKSRVVATPQVGFGQADGGSSSKIRAAHITKPSTGREVTFGPAKPGLFCGRAG